MRPRTRSAALLALLALVLTTGGAWAVPCPPEPAGRDVAAAPAGHAQGHPGGHHAPAPPAPDDRERAPACPLMALGGAGSCAGSFVGAEISRGAVPGPVAHAFVAPRDARDLLLAHRPFHPPEG